MARYKTKLPPKVQSKRRIFPLLMILAGLGLLAVAAWAILGGGRPKAAVEVTGAPRLKVEQDRFDYGDVKLGETVRTQVRLTNTGDQPLKITEAPYVEVVEGC